MPTPHGVGTRSTRCLLQSLVECFPVAIKHPSLISVASHYKPLLGLATLLSHCAVCMCARPGVRLNTLFYLPFQQLPLFQGVLMRLMHLWRHWAVGEARPYRKHANVSHHAHAR
eukprot:1673093-Amphidinium_carterae.2